MLNLMQQQAYFNNHPHFLKAFRPPVIFGPRVGLNVPMNAMGPLPPPQSMTPQTPIPPPQMTPMGHPPPYLEYRILEMNQRLASFFVNKASLNENEQCQWWFAFSQEFMDDNGFITITTLDRNPESKYNVGRQLVPRFFRSLVEHGVCDLQFLLSNSVEMVGTTSNFFITALNSETGEMVVKLEKPMRAEIKTSARYFIEFAPYDEIFGYRIRAWHLELRQPKEFTETPDEQLSEDLLQLKRNGLTICGLPTGVIAFLKMAMVLEPMQVLMSQCKSHNNDYTPRQALKHTLFMEKNRRESVVRQQQQMANAAVANQMNAVPSQPPVEEPPAKKPVRKRTRKPANENGTTNKRSRSKANTQNGPVPMQTPQMPPNGFPGMNPNFNAPMPYSHEVLVVSEPSMMGNEFGAEDERTISRVENAQYNQNNSSMIGGMSMDNGSGIAVMMPNGPPPNGMMMPQAMNGSCGNNFNK